jgi:hypothetical protein
MLKLEGHFWVKRARATKRRGIADNRTCEKNPAIIPKEK